MRNIIAITLTILTVALGLFAVQPSASSSAVLPSFSTTPQVVFDRSTLSWNPTNEWIFPTIITTEHITNPLGAYYLYAAPHDPPGGTALFYSDSPDGPWTEYAGNPVLPNTFGVSHISSPHVMWNTFYNRYHMYFHGENDVTRWAHSADGINWTYGGVSLTARPGMHAVSYARVFEYTVPRLGNRFVMLFHEQFPAAESHIRIRFATSSDGTTFQEQRGVLVIPNGSQGPRISSPTLLLENGTAYVIYHAGDGNMHAVDVGLNFDQEIHLGTFYDLAERVAAPTFLTVDGTTHMYFEHGTRLDADISHTTAPAGVTQTLTPKPFVPYTGYFADTPYTSFYNDIYKIERAGITTGVGHPSTFQPTRNITRGELATFLVRAMDIPHHYTTSTYADVPPQTFYTGPVEALRLAGIASPGTNFRPNDPLTRQEMAVFLSRALGLPPGSGTYFTDVPAGTSFYPWIYAIYNAGITHGVGGTNIYNPTGVVTRQEMATFMARAFDLE